MRGQQKSGEEAWEEEEEERIHHEIRTAPKECQNDGR